MFRAWFCLTKTHEFCEKHKKNTNKQKTTTILKTCAGFWATCIILFLFYMLTYVVGCILGSNSPTKALFLRLRKYKRSFVTNLLKSYVKSMIRRIIRSSFHYNFPFVVYLTETHRSVKRCRLERFRDH